MAKSVISDLVRIFKSSLSAVLPENLITRSCKYNSTTQELTVVKEKYDLKTKYVYLVGAGKAVQNMAREVESILDTKIKHGILSIPENSLQNEKVKNVIYCHGARNNLPDMNSLNTSLKIKDLVTKLGADDLLIVLISGGGSALLTLPKQPVTLDEKTDLIKKLANSGADIKELNIVRKKLSDIKGGQLAIKAQPSQVVTLILSDIVGDPIDLIASGPTVENKDEPIEALQIVKKYKLHNDLSFAVHKALKENTDVKTFPKDNVKNFIIGSNKLSIEAAVKTIAELKYYPIALSNTVTGDIKHIANEYAKLATMLCEYLRGNMNITNLREQIMSLEVPGINVDMIDEKLIGNRKVCIVLGGEITVQVTGEGKGGRNQQLALEFSKHVEEIKHQFEGFQVYILSAGTDGIDGPTDAAGAIGYLGLIPDAYDANLNVDVFLHNNDSYNFFKQFEDGSLHVITGHTNTNVMDIHLILVAKNNESTLL